MQTAEVGPLAWKLVLFSSTEAAFTAARDVAVATALALALAALLIITLWLRRSRLQERRAARIELQRINDELEMRIAERTQVLVDANTSMESKLSELGEAERMLRATQDHAIQAGKLAVLGQMSAGIVHEIAQPLTAMRILSENARKLLSVEEFAEADGNMIEIGDLCRKAGSIVGELKGFAQKSVETFEPVLVDQVTSDAVTLVRRESAGVEFDVRPTSRPVWVSGNSVRLEQVLINLLRNSIDAMKDSAHKMHQHPNGARRTTRRLARARHGQRNFPRGRSAALRAVLHHQGTRARTRPGLGHLRVDRSGHARRNARGEPSRRWSGVHAEAAARAGRS